MEVNMKAKIKKIADILFGWSICLLMIAALIAAFVYIAAFIAGGETATALCAAVKDRILPVMYIAGIVTCAVGVAGMYVGGEHVFIMRSGETWKKNKEKKKNHKVNRNFLSLK